MSRLCSKGQATTELAILAIILLMAFSGMLSWGQVMNKEQEAAMANFRKTLYRAYYDYDKGNGFGGATYQTIKNIRLVEPFSKIYTGTQKQRVAAGNSVLWDPDLLYAEEHDRPDTYYNIDGKEVSLDRLLGKWGKYVRVWDIATNSYTYLTNLEEMQRLDDQGAQDYIKADISEDITTYLRVEAADLIGIGPIEIDLPTPFGPFVESPTRYYNTEETWFTPWEVKNAQ